MVLEEWSCHVLMYWNRVEPAGGGGAKQGFGFGYIKMPKRHIQVKM